MLAMAAFASLWVLLESVVGARLQGRYHLMQVVWCRYAVHLITLVLLCAWTKPERLWRTGRPAYQLARSMLMLVMPLSFTLAIGVGTSGETIWSIFWLSPLLTVAIAHVLLAERAPWETWAAAAVGAVAAVVMLRPQRPSSPLALLLPILMALSFSAYVVMTRSLRHEATRANLLYSALGVFLVLTPIMPTIWIAPTLYDVGVLIGIGVTGLVALLALDRSASLAPVSSVAPVLYLHVVCLSAVGLLLHGQHPSRGSVVGGSVIVAIVSFLWTRQSRRTAARSGFWPAPSEGPAR
jgi:drug/metabolite transporter (DMT)-like permease